MESLKEYSDIIKLYDKQLEFAQTIQKKIIPPASNFHSENYHFYSSLKPFRKVGGDFYDFHFTEDGCVSLLLADATGHGIDAAMITGMVKLIYSYAIKEEELLASPALLLKRLEEDIEQLLPSIFFSAFAVLMNPHNNTLLFANAGHPSGLLISNTTHLLKPTLPLIGLHSMVSDISYINVCYHFMPGDKLLLFTDGLIDAQDKTGDLFGMKRVMHQINTLTGAPLHTLCSRIMAENAIFHGDVPQGDDICLVGLERIK